VVTVDAIRVRCGNQDGDCSGRDDMWSAAAGSDQRSVAVDQKRPLYGAAVERVIAERSILTKRSDD